MSCLGAEYELPPESRCAGCGNIENAVGHLDEAGFFVRQVVASSRDPGRARFLAQRIVLMKNKNRRNIQHIAIMLDGDQICQVCDVCRKQEVA